MNSILRLLLRHQRLASCTPHVPRSTLAKRSARDAGEQENEGALPPLLFQKWGNGVGAAFFISVMRSYMFRFEKHL